MLANKAAGLFLDYITFVKKTQEKIFVRFLCGPDAQCLRNYQNLSPDPGNFLQLLFKQTPTKKSPPAAVWDGEKLFRIDKDVVESDQVNSFT